jgi:hypothetical protein
MFVMSRLPESVAESTATAVRRTVPCIADQAAPKFHRNTIYINPYFGSHKPAGKENMKHQSKPTMPAVCTL